MDTMLGGGPPLPPIEDLPDGGEISKNQDCKRCLEFYSGYGKIEISAIWQKFLPTPDIAIFDQNPFKNEVWTHISKNVVFFPKILQKLIKSKLFFDFLTEVLFAVILSILARTRALWKRKAKPVKIKPKLAKISKNVVLVPNSGQKVILTL